jgi:hypothetical protein
MTPHYFILSIFAIGGSVALLAAIFGWKWFFGAQNAQSVVRRLGLTRARWLYGLAGAGTIALAAYFYSVVSQLPQ